MSDDNPDLVTTWESTRTSRIEQGPTWTLRIDLVSPLMGQPSRAEVQAEVDRVLDDVLGPETLDLDDPGYTENGVEGDTVYAEPDTRDTIFEPDINGLCTHCLRNLSNHDAATLGCYR